MPFRDEETRNGTEDRSFLSTWGRIDIRRTFAQSGTASVTTTKFFLFQLDATTAEVRARAKMHHPLRCKVSGEHKGLSIGLLVSIFLRD